MTVIWSDRSRLDMTSIIARVSADNVSASIRLRDCIFGATEKLGDYPTIGREGRRAGTRELVVPGTPYLVVYQALRDNALILRVLHGARDRP
ncbi:type II toxin-antitoxin system RelE/ParE family toxin [Maricaulis sp.]|uniref:type II toxin-antitoxin system RelE/ParE family toxin n=1 Tax=Maricaulis sp. TaxID=1486257 RepID=UPI0034515C3C